MGPASRRAFLKLCAASAPALALGRGAFGGQKTGSAHTPATVDRYIDPLPIPPRHSPQGKRGNAILYRVRMMEFERPLHSQLAPARLWGYEGHYPGPIFEAMRGQPIEVEWRNELPAQHLFAVDTQIHGAMPPAPAVRTVPHLHGSRTDSVSDGLPEKWFTPGQSAVYRYPNDQQAAPLWYHDHALGITRLNVYAGLSGFYFLRDARELSLKLPTGDYEIPLVLQDRTLDEQGQLAYTPSWDDGTDVPVGRWGPQFFGALPVVNGGIYPHLEVEPRMYRLRVLNAANSRFFRLYLNLAKSATDIPALVRFQQIGSDGGLLPAPAAMQKMLLGPAERADLIVDFTGLEGRTVTLSNDAAAPYPGWTLMHELHPPLNELMQFRVTRPLSAARAYSVPPAMALPRFDPAKSLRTRDFVLTDTMDAQGRSLGMFINGKGYDAPTTELPKLGTQETWRFINTTDDSHPMHLHLVQYQILSRQGFNASEFTQGRLQLEGSPRPPAANEAGWKDTAVVDPYEVLTILVRFEGYTGKYVFHCHMAEHEDHDMMRPFVVVAGDPAEGPPAPAD